MGDEPTRPGDLSFDKAEFTEGAAVPAAECDFCKQPLVGSYFVLAGRASCERCKTQYEYDQATGSGSGRFLRASVFGLGAAAAGSALWYAVRVITNYEIGLIAILVGLMVGGAVRAGSRHRGGPLYQALAIALTYFGICAQYVPDIVKAIRNQAAQEQAQTQAPAAPSPAAGQSPAATPVTTLVTQASAPAPREAPAPSLGGFLMAIGLLLAFAMAAPFLGGFQNLIGILIIGFALYEAWKMNKRVPVAIEGPFRLGSESR